MTCESFCVLQERDFIDDVEFVSETLIECRATIGEARLRVGNVVVGSSASDKPANVGATRKKLGVDVEEFGIGETGLEF